MNTLERNNKTQNTHTKAQNMFLARAHTHFSLITSSKFISTYFYWIILYSVLWGLKGKRRLNNNVSIVLYNIFLSYYSISTPTHTHTTLQDLKHDGNRCYYLCNKTRHHIILYCKSVIRLRIYSALFPITFISVLCQYNLMHIIIYVLN